MKNLVNKYALEKDNSKNVNANPNSKKDNIEHKSSVEGYPIYPATEDIYNKFSKEEDLNPEDITKRKSPKEIAGTRNEKDFKEDMSGSDLDVPGSELDDQQEGLGSEDEENNYYSLGGDNHNDLDEDKG